MQGPYYQQPSPGYYPYPPPRPSRSPVPWIVAGVALAALVVLGCCCALAFGGGLFGALVSLAATPTP